MTNNTIVDALDVSDELTEAEALNELVRQMSTAEPGPVIGLTSEQISDITGWGIKKVRKELRKLAKAGRLNKVKFPVVSLLDGKAYPVIHYSLKKE